MTPLWTQTWVPPHASQKHPSPSLSQPHSLTHTTFQEHEAPIYAHFRSVIPKRGSISTVSENRLRKAMSRRLFKEFQPECSPPLPFSRALIASSMRSEADALAAYMFVSCLSTRRTSSRAASFSTRLLFAKPDCPRVVSLHRCRWR